jgi:imidazolonepropionase-like amidohydrolase
MPFVPGLYRDLLAWTMTTDAGLRLTQNRNGDKRQLAMQSIRYLKEAGVPLVVGSDSGNWPLFPYYFHGPTTWRELRMLAEAGLSQPEILRAATVDAAEMLGLSDHISAVDVGKVADLLVVRDDPLVDVEKSMRSLQYTIRAGVARTPDGWTAAA